MVGTRDVGGKMVMGMVVVDDGGVMWWVTHGYILTVPIPMSTGMGFTRVWVWVDPKIPVTGPSNRSSVIPNTNLVLEKVHGPFHLIGDQRQLLGPSVTLSPGTEPMNAHN